MAIKIKDIIGLKVHWLTVVEYAGKSKGKRPRCQWKCLCECGNFTIVGKDALTAKKTRSCGCLISPPKDKYLIKLQERLFKKTKEENGCWIWMKGKDLYGYGRTTIKNTSISAHRASWIAWKGDIPDKIYVLHKCDNPQCINPDHLFLGTQKDNMKDMISKKRDLKAKGENSGTSKLKNEQIEQIEQIRESIKSSYDISKDFNVSASNIRAIRNNKTWKS